MFIARRHSATLLWRKSGLGSHLSGIAMPLFRTEPEEGRLVAINIALLRSGGSDMFCSRTDICKEL